MNLKITSISLFVLLISICSINSQQWQQLNGPYGGSVRAFLSEGPFIYAGCSPGGVYRSSNNGSSWQPVNEGIDRFDLEFRPVGVVRPADDSNQTSHRLPAVMALVVSR